MNARAWLALGGVVVVLLGLWMWIRDQGRASFVPEAEPDSPRTLNMKGQTFADAPTPAPVRHEFAPDALSEARVELDPIGLAGLRIVGGAV